MNIDAELKEIREEVEALTTDIVSKTITVGGKPVYDRFKYVTMHSLLKHVYGDFIESKIKELLEEKEKEVKDSILCSDRDLHSWKLKEELYEPSYHQIHECIKCGRTQNLDYKHF